MASYRDPREAPRQPWERPVHDGGYVARHSSVSPGSEAARLSLDTARALHVVDEVDGIDDGDRAALRLFLLAWPSIKEVA